MSHLELMKAVRREMAYQVPCKKCQGEGFHTYAIWDIKHGEDYDTVDCDACDGAGMVTASEIQLELDLGLN